MRNRTGQLDVRHALTSDLGQRDLGTAFFADHATMLHALVLAAQAFVVLNRTKNGCAEQTIAFRLKSPVVDGLRLF